MSEQAYRKELAASLRKGGTGLCATYNSLKEVEAYLEKLSGTERVAAGIVYGITVNTMLKVLADQIEEEECTTTSP